MKTLYLECKMGAAGDMLMASLLELLPDRQTFIDKMNAAGIQGVEISYEASVKCGISGTHMIVKVNGMEEHEYFHTLKHEHDHAGHHGHDHVHTGMHEIRHIISNLNISEKVRADVLDVYSLIAEAESHAHGIPAGEVHFHEVGALDAVADITGVCTLMEMLAPEKIIASPVNTGSGHVHCTHGTLPVPAPATAFILRGIPSYSSDARGELCTPTGAALLKHFVSKFCDMPVMTVYDIGYGMGMKDFEQANCVRAMLGETADEDGEAAAELHCNLDDMTPEAIAFAAARLFDAGAFDVWTESIGMKKNRPGIKLCCLCSTDKRDEMIRLIFKHTATIGIREYTCVRRTLQRTEISAGTKYGPVRVKRSEGYGVVREKPEFDDLAKLAVKNGISPGFTCPPWRTPKLFLFIVYTVHVLG